MKVLNSVGFPIIRQFSDFVLACIKSNTVCRNTQCMQFSYYTLISMSCIHLSNFCGNDHPKSQLSQSENVTYLASILGMKTITDYTVLKYMGA